MKKQAKRTFSEIVASLEPLPGYLTVKEAAKIIGVSESSVYSYVARGKLPGWRLGHTIMVREKQVQSYKRGTPGHLRATSTTLA